MEALYTYSFPSKMPVCLQSALLGNVLKSTRHTMEIVKLWKDGILLRDAMVDILFFIEGILVMHSTCNY